MWSSCMNSTIISILFTLIRSTTHVFSKPTPIATSSSSFSSSPIPPPPSISLPVYSLSVPLFIENDSPTSNNNRNLPSNSMNIMTFASPVSVQSPKLWMLSLYKNTMSHDYFLKNKQAILQLLSPEHKSLISILGKKSGYDICKEKHCEDLGFVWKSIGNSKKVLPNCQSYIELKMVGNFIPALDHEVAICEVVATYKWDSNVKEVVQASIDEFIAPKDPTNTLYTALLKEEGII